jgi:hypothetical protein
LEASKIREVAELGMKQDGVLPLWFGEGAWPTNSLIVNGKRCCEFQLCRRMQ